MATHDRRRLASRLARGRRESVAVVIRSAGQRVRTKATTVSAPAAAMAPATSSIASTPCTYATANGLPAAIAAVGRDWASAPSAAIPAAVPSRRAVLLTPEAIPRSSRRRGGSDAAWIQRTLLQANEDTVTTPRSAALLRHFADLRDGSHGGVTSRPGKERLFAQAVVLIDPYAHRALDEINADLLLETGEVTATGVRRSATAGLDAV